MNKIMPGFPPGIICSSGTAHPVIVFAACHGEHPFAPAICARRRVAACPHCILLHFFVRAACGCLAAQGLLCSACHELAWCIGSKHLPSAGSARGSIEIISNLTYARLKDAGATLCSAASEGGETGETASKGDDISIERHRPSAALCFSLIRAHAGRSHCDLGPHRS